MLLALLLLASPDPGRELVLEPALGLRLVTSSEWDTNARRAIDTNVFLQQRRVRTGEVVGDGLFRLQLEAQGDLTITRQDTVHTRYLLGAKRFFREEGEDILTHDLSVASYHHLAGPLWLEPNLRLRASRMRNDSRDYSIFGGGGGLGLELGSGWRLSALGRFDTFSFQFYELSWVGPTAGGELMWQPTEQISIAGFVEHAWRSYEGPVREEQNGTLLERCKDGNLSATSCADPELRRDTELAVGARVLVRAGVILGGEIAARFQRSNTAFEETDRYGISAFATVPLWLELLLTVQGGLQLTRGLSATQTVYAVEDDENQNRLEVQLARRIAGDLGAQVRYALYANEFATSETRFLRQVFHLGLTYQVGRDR